MSVLRRKWTTARSHIARHGLRRTLVFSAFSLLWRFRLGRVGLLMRLAPGAPATASAPPGITIREIDHDDVRRLADPANARFEPAVLASCTARGDRCFAAFDGPTLVGAAWFSTGAVRQLGAFWRTVPPAVLEHLAWVAPPARGRGVMGAVTAAFRRQSPGVPVIAVVEIGNYAERRVMHRAGHRPAGILIQLGPESWNLGVAVRRARLLCRVPRGASWPRS